MGGARRGGVVILLFKGGGRRGLTEDYGKRNKGIDRKT